MHNLHFLIVNAETAEEAMSNSEMELTGWGNENNWRAMLAAIPSKGKIVMGDNAPDRHDIPEFNTLAKINKTIDNLTIGTYYRDAFKRVKAGKIENSFDWYVAGTYCHKMHEMLTKAKPFNVLKHSYNEGKYDDFGVTHLSQDKPMKGQKKWVVLMDMHS